MSEAAADERGREVWIEKYRPQTLEDVLGQDAIVDRLQSYINRNDLPHLLFSGPAGIGKCATGETPVLTNHGIEPIADIVGEVHGFDSPPEDLEILTFDEQGEFEYVEPSHVYAKEADRLVRVSTRDGGELTVTPEHKLLVVSSAGMEWKQAGDLSTGERIARPLHAPLPEGSQELQWIDTMDGDRTLVHVTESFAREHDIPIEENFVGKKKQVIGGLRRGESEGTIAERAETPVKTVQDYRRDASELDLTETSTICSLSYLRGLDVDRSDLESNVTAIQYVNQNNHRSTSISPPWKITPDLARFVGLTVSEARIDGGRIKFYNTDDRLLSQFESAAESVFGLTPTRGEQKDVPYLELGNRTLTHLLEACFDVFAGTTVEEGIGSTLVRADSESQSAFLQAVFDAEAHVSESGHIELVQKNERLITLVSYLLAGVGVPSRRKTTQKSATNGSETEREYHVLYISGADHLARFEERVGFTLEAKAERLADCAARDANPNDDTVPTQEAVHTLCDSLGITKKEHVPETLDPDSPGRENYLAALDSLLDAANAKLEAAQESLERLARLRPVLDEMTAVPAAWDVARSELEPIEVRRNVSETVGVRSDRLLEYADGRRSPGGERAVAILTELGAVENPPDTARIQSDLRDTIEELGISYNRVAESTRMRGTEIASLLESGNDLRSLPRFETVADRVRTIATEMLTVEVLEALQTLDVLVSGDLYFDTVESTEELDDTRRVYDLTVPESRNYVAGQVPTVMHNTTCATAIARELYGEDWQEHFLELNASDQRGIDVVRDRIKSFARSSFGGQDYRIIFLDEADALCLPPGAPVVTGPPSSPEVKPIEDVSTEGEPIPSVDFGTNEPQPDRGRLLRTGTADFYRLELGDGRGVVASPRHPFFVVGDGQRLVERELRNLEPGDEIADFRGVLGLSECEACGSWTGNSRFCSQECKDSGHSAEMSGSGNPMHGRDAWNRGLTKADDERVAAQANLGPENGNYGGDYHGQNPWDDPDVAATLREKLSEAMSGRSLDEAHRKRIGLGVVNHHRDGELSMDEYDPHYRRVVPDEDTVECEVCGEQRQTSGRDGIYVHHIDGDRENDADENLMLVCPRCHNFALHDRRKDLEAGWQQNSKRTDVTDGGRAVVETATVEAVEFDHHGPAYNITMEGTPNFALANGILTHNTSDAQSALRRTMEQFSNNTRFILSCNYSSQIIDPIQSRCAVFRFSPLSDEAVAEQIYRIAENEDIELTEDGVDALVYAADGDMRKAINGLQAAAVMGDVVDEEAVYAITSTARPEEIKEMVTRALEGDFTAARSTLDRLLTEEGIAGGDVIDQLHRSVWEFDIDDEAAVRLMDRIGEADYRITAGANERVQLEALLASLALEE